MKHESGQFYSNWGLRVTKWIHIAFDKVNLLKFENVVDANIHCTEYNLLDIKISEYERPPIPVHFARNSDTGVRGSNTDKRNMQGLLLMPNGQTLHISFAPDNSL